MVKSRIFSYENTVMVLLALAFGFVFFDRLALNFLAPFIVPELHLTNTQLGAFAAALGLTWAVSGYVVGALSDYLGNRKVLLVAAIIVFSACSVISGLANSFLMLLGARMIMGIAEGPVLPIAQSIMVAESSEHRRGFNMGVIQNFVTSILNGFVAPLALVAIATAYGWRNAFFLAGVPGFIVAVLIIFLIREPKSVAPVRQESVSGKSIGLKKMLSYRNIWICAMISGLMVGWVLIHMTFLPIYLVQARGLTPGEMSIVMATTGVSSAISAMLVPALSDYFGRRPVLALFSFVGVIAPVTAVLFGGSLPVMCLLLGVGFFAIGSTALFMATVPSETIPPAHVATALGFIMGVGEIVGGFGGPGLAGIAADILGPSTPFWMAAAACTVAGGLALLLDETAPRVVGRTKQLEAASAT
ncbi:MFS transporter [Bradyrhizobium sp. 170]|uniref:MFS transporter n=1 Tax=Bradyrhizobium sp. 170 TaxID=2782641 RepID=UPI001FFE6071|nr:MFS transporter [Bradyrhizobium sp. 170]UPK01337.1 MFS transporter [Bradyrhizobium sp. 170]